MLIKKAIICKDVEEFNINSSIKKTHVPKAGDVAVFKVLSTGKHDAIQGVNGNNTYIFEGDYVMLAFGNRYATGQFEGYVPEGYLPRYQILGKGGAVGRLESMNVKLKKVGATDLRLVGYATNAEGNVINTKYMNRSEVTFNPKTIRTPKIILSIGASMDSGKTTTAGYLCRGIMLAKKKVAFIKLTGTVMSKDKSFVRDCGAKIALDFSNAGFPSTYLCDEQEMLNLYEYLLQMTEVIDPDYIVMEIADGLFQRETAMLLRHKAFMSTISGVMFSCGDSLSAMHGIKLLEDLNQNILGICGLFTISPLLVNEVQEETKYPVFTLSDLSSPKIVDALTPMPEPKKMARKIQQKLVHA